MSQNHLQPWTLMPASEGTCPECATEHDPRMPHNAQSLFYQYRFYAEHGRWPQWYDALAHVEDDLRVEWEMALMARGAAEEAVLRPREGDPSTPGPDALKREPEPPTDVEA